MTVYFSEVFKKMRKERDLTQEQMADILCVSPQAISRWETGATYPDISLLPEIAEFFGTTVDDILGTSKAKAEEKIKKYLDEFESAMSKGLVYDCIDIMRGAVKEFPNNYQLLNELMYALFASGDSDGNIAEWKENIEKYYDEIIEIGERILKYCTDDKIRLDAKSRLGFHYSETGHKEKAKEIFNSLPSEGSCRETMIYWALDGNEKVNHIQHEIDRRLSQIVWSIGAYITHGGSSAERKIELSMKQLSIIDSVYDNKEYGDKFITISQIYSRIAELYMELDDTEKSVSAIDKAVDYLISYEQFCVRFTEQNKWKNHTTDTRGRIQIFTEDIISKDCFDKIRDDKRFIESINKLK